MMQRIRLMFFLYFAVTLCVSCGGGGGGGGGGGSSSGSSASTGIRILHASPDNPPVDIYSSLSPVVVQTARFAAPTFYAALDSGAQNILATLTKTPSVTYLSSDITVAKGQRFSYLIYGDNAQLGLRSKIIEDAVPAIADGQSAVRVINALVGAAGVRGSLGSAALPASVAFGAASDYLAVTAGAQTVTLSRAADGRTVYSAAKQFDAGSAYTLLLTGEVGYLVVATQYAD